MIRCSPSTRSRASRMGRGRIRSSISIHTRSRRPLNMHSPIPPAVTTADTSPWSCQCSTIVDRGECHARRRGASRMRRRCAYRLQRDFRHFSRAWVCSRSGGGRSQARTRGQTITGRSARSRPRSSNTRESNRTTDIMTRHRIGSCRCSKHLYTYGR